MFNYSFTRNNPKSSATGPFVHNRVAFNIMI